MWGDSPQRFGAWLQGFRFNEVRHNVGQQGRCANSSRRCWTEFEVKALQVSLILPQQIARDSHGNHIYILFEK